MTTAVDRKIAGLGTTGLGKAAIRELPPRPVHGGLSRALDYPKFTRPQTKAVLLDGNYHLHRECAAALKQLGCQSAAVPVGGDVPQTVSELLFTLVEVKPDFILSVNFIGFDEQGKLGALLEELQIPIAVWCVDSPSFILRRTQVPAPALTSVFLWERMWTDAVVDRGAQNVHYLPLATDPTVFGAAEAAVSRSLLFVGDSMEHARRKWRKRLGRGQRAMARQLSCALLDGTRLDQLMANHSGHAALSEASRSDIWAGATFSATASYRLELLRAVRGADLHLYGDDGWRRLLPGCNYHGPVNYGAPLAQVYASSEISLNATSFQMPTAVNQRVFDVPAAGGFVLTDARDDLQRHFDVGREIVTYSSAEELKDLADYYRRHQTERGDMIQRARARVMAEHTYRHRIKDMIQQLVERHRG